MALAYIKQFCGTTLTKPQDTLLDRQTDRQAGLHQSLELIAVYLLRMFEEMFENHGDTIAQQYGGSHLVHRQTCNLFSLAAN